MERFRLKEALAYAADCGKKINRMEIARILWPDGTENSIRHNLSNLENGHTSKIRVSWVIYLCDYCQCTADMLFGLEPFPNIINKAK